MCPSMNAGTRLAVVAALFLLAGIAFTVQSTATPTAPSQLRGVGAISTVLGGLAAVGSIVALLLDWRQERILRPQ
jgi:hypothetical protein